MEKTVLLIDDEQDFTEIVRTLLDFHQFKVDCINEPTSIEKAVTAKTYDILVTDLMMPHMDGFQLIDTVRRIQGYEHTPIIVLTAKSLTDEERKRLYQHDVSFLTKPFEPQNLVEKITEMLQ